MTNFRFYSLVLLARGRRTLRVIAPTAAVGASKGFVRTRVGFFELDAIAYNWGFGGIFRETYCKMLSRIEIAKKFEDVKLNKNLKLTGKCKVKVNR